MRRMLALVLAVVCALGIAACGSEEKAEVVGIVYHSPQNGDGDTANEKESWSKEEIMAMFSRVKEAEWEYADCVVFPDRASGRIGAVLFTDEEKGTSDVAFFDAEGYCQRCGTYAKAAAEPALTYLGDGAVTFKLQTEDGVIYDYTVTISINDSTVYFKAEDNLQQVRQ